MRTNNFDPLAYIESAFLDKESGLSESPAKPEPSPDHLDALSVSIPTIADYLSGGRTKISISAPIVEQIEEVSALEEVEVTEDGKRAKFRKTVMSAPRPRRSRNKTAPASSQPAIDPELQTVWQTLPKNVAFLCGFYDDSVTKNYYRGEFKETRQELVRRLLDPELSLEETSRLLGVCPATVRRYTNRGWLTHHRTNGGQRRFRLSDIVKFVDDHGRFPEE